MSREDSCKPHTVAAPELKKLMRAPTIEGFVARRSKFNKSVSFQRRTLNSPPFPVALDEFVRRNGSTEDASKLTKSLLKQSSLGIQSIIQRPRNAINIVEPKDGMNKLLSKLNNIGVETNEVSDAENLVLGVRKILQDKMVDIHDSSCLCCQIYIH